MDAETEAAFDRFWALISGGADWSSALYSGATVYELARRAFAAGAMGADAVLSACEAIQIEEAEAGRAPGRAH